MIIEQFVEVPGALALVFVVTFISGFGILVLYDWIRGTWRLRQLRRRH